MSATNRLCEAFGGVPRLGEIRLLEAWARCRALISKRRRLNPSSINSILDFFSIIASPRVEFQHFAKTSSTRPSFMSTKWPFPSCKCRPLAGSRCEVDPDELLCAAGSCSCHPRGSCHSPARQCDQSCHPRQLRVSSHPPSHDESDRSRHDIATDPRAVT